MNIKFIESMIFRLKKDRKIKIYKGPVDDEKFILETTKVVVFQK